MTGPCKRVRAAPALFALLALLLAQGLLHRAWFDRDGRIPFWDQERYFDMTRAARSRLDEGRFASLLALHESHPPLYPLAAALFTLGRPLRYEDARLFNIPLALLTSVLSYLLALRLLRSRAAGVLAAAFSAFAPLAFAFTHMYYIENLLVPLVLLGWLLWLPPGPGSVARGAVAGAVLGLGCLAKWTYPVFLAVPVAISLPGLLKRRTVALAAALAAAAVALPWYATHSRGILGFLDAGVTSGEGHLSAVRGIEGVAYYPFKMVFTGVGLPVALLAALGLAAVFRESRSRGAALGAILLFAIAVFTAILTKKPRHLLPLVPLVGVLAAAGIFAGFRGTAGRACAAGLALLFLLAATLHTSFAIPERLPEFRTGSAVIPLFTRPSPPGAPDARIWPYDLLLDAFHSHRRAEHPPEALVLFNLLPFREGGFRHHIYERSLPLWCSLIPFANLDPPEPFPLLRTDRETPGLLDRPFLISKTAPFWVRYQSGAAAHHHGARVAEELHDPGSRLGAAYRCIARAPLPDGGEGRVFMPLGDPSRPLAVLALRFEPLHAGAWRVLGIPPPSGETAARARLVELGILPPDALSSATESQEEREERLLRLIHEHPLREELLLAAKRQAAANSKAWRDAREILDLWEEYRTGSSFDAAARLASIHAAAGRLPAAIRWWRRAAESDRGRRKELLPGIGQAGLEAEEAGILTLLIQRDEEGR